MTKYTRSKAKLMVLVKEVFGVYGVSIDTKVIILFLAATMPREKFKRWLNNIEQLNPYNAHFQEINELRCKFGEDFRNYLLLIAFQHAKNKISSAELQQLILAGHVDPEDFTMQNICEDLFAPAFNNAAQAGEDDFERAVQIARHFIPDDFDVEEICSQTLLNAYLACRKYSQTNVAANAVIYVLWQVLRAQNYSIEAANIASKKLVLQALQPFIKSRSSKPLLFHAYH